MGEYPEKGQGKSVEHMWLRPKTEDLRILGKDRETQSEMIDLGEATVDVDAIAWHFVAATLPLALSAATPTHANVFLIPSTLMLRLVNPLRGLKSLTFV